MVFADLLRAFDLLRNSRKPRQQVHRPNAPLGLGKLEPLVAFEPRVDWRGNIVERAKELYLNVVSAFFRDFREGIEIVFVAGILWRVPAKNNAAAVSREVWNLSIALLPIRECEFGDEMISHCRSAARR